MKYIVIMMAIYSLVNSELFASFTTNRYEVLALPGGKTLHNARPTRIDANDVVVFIHSEGIDSVPVLALSDDLRSSLGYPTRDEVRRKKEWEKREPERKRERLLRGRATDDPEQNYLPPRSTGLTRVLEHRVIARHALSRIDFNRVIQNRPDLPSVYIDILSAEEIRTGPGYDYAPYGDSLDGGEALYILAHENGWLEFRVTPHDVGWSAWIHESKTQRRSR